MSTLHPNLRSSLNMNLGDTRPFKTNSQLGLRILRIFERLLDDVPQNGPITKKTAESNAYDTLSTQHGPFRLVNGYW